MQKRVSQSTPGSRIGQAQYFAMGPSPSPAELQFESGDTLLNFVAGMLTDFGLRLEAYHAMSARARRSAPARTCIS